MVKNLAKRILSVHILFRSHSIEQIISRKLLTVKKVLESINCKTQLVEDEKDKTHHHLHKIMILNCITLNMDLSPG
jgi:hypothetical protein